jgi:hypothetical protein
MDPQHFVCTKHLKNIHDIESCDLTEYHPFNMRADAKSEKQGPTNAPFDREAMIGLVRNMRLAATYGANNSSEYESGFFMGWTTACGAILSALGDSPYKWMKDEDR